MARKFDQIRHAPKPTSILRSAALVLASGLFFAGPSDLQGAVFLGEPFALTDPASGTTQPVTANPYPGNIVVANLEAIPLTGGNVTLTLNSFARSGRPDDLDILLVAPTGASLIVWSDVGGTGAATSTLTITLSDSGASFLPDAGPLTSGTFKPTNQSTVQDAFPTIAPPGPYGNPGPVSAGVATFASQFNGIDPNGTWSLFILDDTPNSGGETTSIANWSLDINATVIPEPSTLALIALGGAPLLVLLRRKMAA
ncbi:MAG TPA: PEP-CTERM sorting domain-containing protein [Terrimicrobiaceae bacterium]